MNSTDMSGEERERLFLEAPERKEREAAKKRAMRMTARLYNADISDELKEILIEIVEHIGME